MGVAKKRGMVSAGTEGHQFLSAGHVIANRYKILRPLGTGGMASVYLAEDIVLGETNVAIKVLRQGGQFKEDLVHRFLREVRLTHKINHENVVRTFDFGQDGDTLYYTMEYLSGRTLESLVSSELMPLEGVLGVAVQLMRGISAVHAVGVIHRDIKPANIMILEQGSLKITDFGISRGGVSNLTAVSGEIVVTIAYPAPETLIGEESSIAVDYYAIGAILYQLLTGRPPIDDDVPARLIMRKVEEMPPDPRELRPDVPEWLAHGLLSLLEIDPKLRMRSLPTFAANLDAKAPRQLDEGLVAGLINNTITLDKLLDDAPLHTRIYRRVAQGHLTTRLMFGALLALFSVPLSTTDTFVGMEFAQSDNLFRLRGMRDPSPDVMVISMDETSYSTLGVPVTGAWPRQLHTKLLTRLADDKAKRVVFDIIFSDVSADQSVDADLAAAMKRVPTVLAAASGTTQQATLNGTFLLEELIRPAAVFEDAAVGIGLVGLPQRFGRVRQFNVERSDLFPDVPSLAEAGAMPPKGDKELPDRNSLINFYGDARTIPTVPYQLVVDDTKSLPAGTFTGKIVFVGLGLRSRTGPSQRESFVTPFDQGMFGTEIHATATSNILNRDWVEEVQGSGRLAVCFGLAACMAFLILTLSGAKAVLSLCLAVVGAFALQYILFLFGALVPLACPILWGLFSGLFLRLLFSQTAASGWRRR